MLIQLILTLKQSPNRVGNAGSSCILTIQKDLPYIPAHNSAVIFNYLAESPPTSVLELRTFVELVTCCLSVTDDAETIVNLVKTVNTSEQHEFTKNIFIKQGWRLYEEQN